MQQTQLTDIFFYGMANNEKLNNLLLLNLSKAFLITDEGFTHFIKSAAPINLQTLDISQTRLSDLSIEGLVFSQVSRLRVFIVRDCVDIREHSLILYLNS